MSSNQVIQRVVVIVCLVIVCLSTLARCAFAEDFTLRSFRKIAITDKFYSEGMYYGDFNHDGKTDVVAGSLWYAGPDFQTSHEFRPGKPFDPNGYSDAFLMFAYDFNGDGWDDPLVAGWPGKQAYWYENPAGKDVPWKQHLAFPILDNESPGFADINGDGKPELICHTAGVLGFAEPDAKQPGERWRFHEASAKGKWGRYNHGLGYGDINGDGRTDLLMREGWWEQPPKESAEQLWTHHKVNFGGGGAQMHVYDVDDDGDSDVVTSLEAHGFGLAWFEQTKSADGEIAFTQHLIMGGRPQENRYGVKFSQLHAVDMADMDGDGVKDIITGKRFWAHGPKGDKEPGAPAVLYWFRLVREKDGTVDFVPHLIDNDSGVGTQVIAADVTNDGLVDVIVGNKKGHFVFVQETKAVSKEVWDAAQPTPLP